MAAAISNAIVGIHSRHYGKGPTKAKTYIIDDTVVCVMQDVFTTVEHTLIDNDQGSTVRDMRLTFQYALRDEFEGEIERITGRKPRCFMSQIDWKADMAVELFILEDGNGTGDATDVTQDGDRPS